MWECYCSMADGKSVMPLPAVEYKFWKTLKKHKQQPHAHIDWICRGKLSAGTLFFEFSRFVSETRPTLTVSHQNVSNL